MSDQQPPEAPSLLTILPSELWLKILDLLSDEYLEEEKRKGRQYLPHSLACTLAPWNVFETLLGTRDLVRTCPGAHVTMLHPVLTRSGLAGRPKDVSLHFYYTDADDWTPFDRKGTFDFSIPAAVKLALRELENAKTLTVSATTLKLAHYPLFNTGRLSNVERVRLLAKILQKLSTRTAPVLQQLSIWVDSNMTPEDVQTAENDTTSEDDTTSEYDAMPEDEMYVRHVEIQRNLHANESLFWTRAADLFPGLECLELAGLHCTLPPRIPPSLTKLELSCTFTISMDDLLDMLQSLPRLRDLALSNCLPDLQNLALQERLPALVTILSHLDFQPTTSMELGNDVDDSSTQGVDVADAISTLALEVQSHLDPGLEENLPVFGSLEIKLSEQVDTFDLHGKAGSQTVDIWCDWPGIRVTTALALS